EFPAEVQKVRPGCCRTKRLAFVADAENTLQENRGQPLEFVPQRILAGVGKGEGGGNCAGNPELSRLSVFGHREVPGESILDRRIVPYPKLVECTHPARAPGHGFPATQILRTRNGSQWAAGQRTFLRMAVRSRALKNQR